MLSLTVSPYISSCGCGGCAPGYPCCYEMRPTRANQCIAARDLVRPDEVAHLVVDMPHPRLPNCRLARATYVAVWLRTQFATGALRYIPDPTGPLRDYWCSPSATFERGGGDCDDLGILACSMMRVTSDAWCVIGTWKGVGHLWVEGVDEIGPFMLEATNGNLYREKRPRGYKVQLVANDVGCVH